jgi:hypothetical protein
MSVTVQINREQTIEMDEREAQATIEEHLGLHFEYITFDSKEWSIQLKTPGRKVVIRPTHIGREMKFEIILC